MNGEIGVLYIGYDDPWLSMVILETLRKNEDMGVVYIGGDGFPFAKQLLAVPDLPFKVVVLHMLAPCHELGYRHETDENLSTGLRRAEILREQGFAGQIVLISTTELGMCRKLIHDYDQRVESAKVQFVRYDNAFQSIVDAVRRVAI